MRMIQCFVQSQIGDLIDTARNAKSIGRALTGTRWISFILIWSIVLIAGGLHAASSAEEVAVTVKPLFFVPSDQKGPSKSEKQSLARHLNIAQERYSQMLRRRDTFTIAEGGIDEFKSANPLEYFQSARHSGASEYTVELLAHYNATQETCPYIFVIVLMNPDRNYPHGGGRPLMGGVNKGGGIVIMSSHALNNVNNFQSTLQHELGHSFGLTHVNVYGYDMKNNPSVMSYNPKHHWDGFKSPVTQGILNPEDMYVLAKNKKVFPNLKFDPKQDVPKGYRRKRPKYLGKMDLSLKSFELFINGKSQTESNTSFEDALLKFQEQRESYAGKKVTAKYRHIDLIVSGEGYELYWNYERVGHEPAWNYQRAIKNLKWNKDKRKDQATHGLFNGKPIQLK